MYTLHLGYASEADVILEKFECMGGNCETLEPYMVSQFAKDVLTFNDVSMKDNNQTKHLYDEPTVAR